MSENKIVTILAGHTIGCKNHGVYEYSTQPYIKGGKIHVSINYIIQRFRLGVILNHWLDRDGETSAISYPYKDGAIIVLPVSITFKVCEKLEKAGFEVNKVFLMKSKEDYYDCPDGFLARINLLKK